MWRQADNPLARSDKYEALRAFPAATLRSLVLGKGEERKGGYLHHLR